jgi:hypothetical protein
MSCTDHRRRADGRERIFFCSLVPEKGIRNACLHIQGTGDAHSSITPVFFKTDAELRHSLPQCFRVKKNPMARREQHYNSKKRARRAAVSRRGFGGTYTAGVSTSRSRLGGTSARTKRTGIPPF